MAWCIFVAYLVSLLSSDASDSDSDPDESDVSSGNLISRGRVFHPISKHREEVKKTHTVTAEIFLTYFEVFGYLMKNCF